MSLCLTPYFFPYITLTFFLLPFSAFSFFFFYVLLLHLTGPTRHLSPLPVVASSLPPGASFCPFSAVDYFCEPEGGNSITQ